MVQRKKSFRSQLQIINYAGCDEPINCRKLTCWYLLRKSLFLKFNMLKWFLSYQKSKYPLTVRLSETGLTKYKKTENAYKITLKDA